MSDLSQQEIKVIKDMLRRADEIAGQYAANYQHTCLVLGQISNAGSDEQAMEGGSV